MLAAIAGHMAENSISLESIVQREEVSADKDEGQSKMIVLITHGTTKASIETAMSAIRNDGYLLDDPQMIRIETF